MLHYVIKQPELKLVLAQTVILNFKLPQLDTEYPIFSFMTWYILKEIDTLLW